MSYAEDSWRTAWLRGGRISEVAWINQDTMAWCCGIHLVFFDVPSNKLLLPRLSYDIVSAGASCLSAHPSYGIFAFSEKSLEPRILVYAYPSMMKLCECTNGTKYAYLSTTFVEDFLVSLSSFPDFNLTFWSWRTGEKITSVQTSVCDAESYGQILKANFSRTSFIAQLGNESSTLLTWEVKTCNKVITLNKNNVVLPNNGVVQDVAWCPESSDTLAIVDKNGFIYLSNPRGNDIQPIVRSQRCLVCSRIEPTAICWFRGGILLRTTFCQIRYYQKNDHRLWSKVWLIKCTSSPSILTSHYFRNDRLFFITVEGHLIQVDYSENSSKVEQNVKHYFRGKYLFADFLQPWEEHIVAVDSSMELSVINVDTGFEITSINLTILGNVTCMVSHPHYPIMVVCSDKGEVVFVSFLDYHIPKILGTYRLQSEKLDIMEFSSSGRHLIVCQKNIGICYLFINSFPNSVEIRTRLEANIRIVDIMLFESDNNVHLYILEGLLSTVSIGNKLLQYDLGIDQDKFKKSSQAFGFMNYFLNLHSIPDTINMFVGSPYLTKQLRFYKINDSKDVLLTHIKCTEHKIRQVKLFKNKKWLITSGIDGLLIVTKINTNGNDYFYTHHRHESNIIKASINSAGNALITIGVDGSIIFIKNIELINETPSNSSFKNFYEYLYSTFDYHEEKVAEYTKTLNKEKIEFLSKPFNTYLDSETSGKTWIEWKKEQKIKEEYNSYHANKQKILSKLKYLRTKIMQLLNKNETASQLRKFPISTFNLNKVYYEKKLKSAKDQREEVRRKWEFDCQEMERVANWIKRNFWDCQTVLGRSIFGLFDNTEVSNYPFHAEAKVITETIKYSQFKHEVLNEIMDVETVYPWDDFSHSELLSKFNKQVRLKKDYDDDNDADVDDDDYDDDGLMSSILELDEESKQEKEREKYIFEGLTTFYFVQPNTYCSSQFKSYSFSQLICDNYSFLQDRKKLRSYFNKLFDDLHAEKKREMNLLFERVDRIQHVSSELEKMFNIYVDDVIVFPQWNIKEMPENIIQVTEDEIPVKPYISESVQELRDKQAAEEEMARLAMMADDFRDRALDEMMDGVLEIRWEDTIKKNPPKPVCIEQGKKPEDYTEEDNLAVKRYELNMKHLEEEREKYQKILQNEYKRNNILIKEGMRKFNLKLEEFFFTKMKVESAVQQLNLHFLRRYNGHLERMNTINFAEIIKNEIEKNNESIEKLTEDLHVFEKVDEELQSSWERLNIKDKFMEKKFKNDFPGVGKNSLATMFALFKRRPRTVLKNITASELLDIGKSITSMKNIPYISSESREYIKSLVNMDIRPLNLPATINDSHWKTVVALRRLKIDHELRMRAVEKNIEQAIELLEIYNRSIQELKLENESMKEELKRLHKELIEEELDLRVQLVVKMGQMEVEALTGDLRKDMVGSILVPRADVEKVNNVILASGRSKLSAIRRNLEFRRRIVHKQWQLDCLYMKVNHLEVGLYFTKTATLTREMQTYLTRKAKGLKDDKTPYKIKKKTEYLRKSQEKIVKEYDAKLEITYKEIVRIRETNEKLDAQITQLNVNRCEMELQRDIGGEERNKEHKVNIFKLVAEKGALVRKIVQNNSEILDMKKQKDHVTYVPHPSIKYS